MALNSANELGLVTETASGDPEGYVLGTETKADKLWKEVPKHCLICGGSSVHCDLPVLLYKRTTETARAETTRPHRPGCTHISTPRLEQPASQFGCRRSAHR